jgi:ADP-ribose pyrophosphatase
MKKKKHWTVIDTEKGYWGDWIDLNVDLVELPDGEMIEYEALYYHRAGVGVVAENNEGKIILVKSYRYINDYTGWEVPAGTVPPEQGHFECIIQELKEEAGCEVSPEDLIYTGYYYPSIGSSSQVFHCYYAKSVTQVTQQFDTNEILDAKWFSKDEILELIKKGEIKDGFTLTLLLRKFESL